MTLQIDYRLMNAIGGAPTLDKAIAAFAQALIDHAKTIDVPAPTAYPLVEEIVRKHEGAYEIINVPPPDEEPAPLMELPLSLQQVAAARLLVDGWDVTGIERSSGLSLAFVADTDTVWVFFDEPQPDTEYLVVPPDGTTKYVDHIEVAKPGLTTVSLIVQRVL